MCFYCISIAPENNKYDRFRNIKNDVHTEFHILKII